MGKKIIHSMRIIHLEDSVDKHMEVFDLAISDMHYPIRRGEIADWEAGEYFLKALAERNINLPVIICSTRNYRIPGAYGSVWFSDLSDWEMDLRNLINGLGK